MKWIKITDQYPNYPTDFDVFLITDGKKIYTAYMDHGEIWLNEDVGENYYEVLKRITHWIDKKDIPMPIIKLEDELD